MNCTQCREYLMDQQRDLLALPAREALGAHVEQCASCATYARGLDEIFLALDQQEPPSPALQGRFEARLSREVSAGTLPATSRAGLFERLWPSRPAWALCYSFTLVSMGLMGGRLLPHEANAPSTVEAGLICPVHSPFEWPRPAARTLVS